MAKRKQMAADATLLETCEKWLPQKRRQCKFPRVHGSPFCGNHIVENSQTGGRRVPCPFDPNHTILESEVESHLRKCPKLRQATARSKAAYFWPDCNYGSGEEIDLQEAATVNSFAEQLLPSQTLPLAVAASNVCSPISLAAAAGDPPAVRTASLAGSGPAQTWVQASSPAGSIPAARKGQQPPSSAQRAAYAARMGEACLRNLIGRIQTAHKQACSCMAATVEELRPGGSDRNLRSEDPLRPFSLKHARQQASIVAHVQRAGLVPPHSWLHNLPAEIHEPAVHMEADTGSVVTPQPEGVTPAAVAVIGEAMGLSDGCQTVNPVMRHGVDGTRLASSSAAVAEGGNQTVYVEFGAGTGYLSAHLAECTSARRLILLDRGSFRMKADRHLRDLEMRRLRCDIGDFEPAGLPALCGSTGRWVAIGKHLCGGATDLTLRCCVRSEAARAQGRDLARLAGIAVATCCHHRCSWRQYVNKAFFLGLGLSAPDFELMVWMTGWALCGHEAPTEEPEDVVITAEGGVQSALAANGLKPDIVEAVSGGDAVADLSSGMGAPGVPHAGKSLTRQERIGIGQKCKQLMDQGRLEWLQQHGFQASIVLYVPPSVSGENRLLLATTGTMHGQLET